MSKIIVKTMAVIFGGGLFYGLYTIYSEVFNKLFFITLFLIFIGIVLNILATSFRSFFEQKPMTSYDYKRKVLKKFEFEQNPVKSSAKEADTLRQEIKRKELALLRDRDNQAYPYTFQVGNHANESLAIRYGIANMKHNEPAKHIRLQKIRKIEKDKYEVLLKDYRDRKAIAVIEVGTEYVKTFYPLNDKWFEKYEALETTLKGNGSFTLKELATFHVQKTVS